MRVVIVTLFPELVEAFASASIVGRARSQGHIGIECEPLRAHGLGRHQSVDDTPYGGGSGMVLRVDCVAAALDAAQGRLGDLGAASRKVLLSPQGRRFDQSQARRLVEHPALILVCGRYEGFDERARGLVDEELSLGDFVLAGGEVAAMAVVEACARLVPGVLGNAESLEQESFNARNHGGLELEYPQYTRPLTFRGNSVPPVLLSGNHGAIAEWRGARSRERTITRRPDLVGESAALAEDTAKK